MEYRTCMIHYNDEYRIYNISYMVETALLADQVPTLRMLAALCLAKARMTPLLLGLRVYMRTCA